MTFTEAVHLDEAVLLVEQLGTDLELRVSLVWHDGGQDTQIYVNDSQAAAISLVFKSMSERINVLRRLQPGSDPPP